LILTVEHGFCSLSSRTYGYKNRYQQMGKKGIIIKIPKKGDRTKCGNWKGIFLLSTPGKILSKVIQNQTASILKT
jgi:hypothetical protein